MNYRPPGVGKKLLGVMCSDVWLTAYELLLLYEYNVDEDVNPKTLTHMICEMKKKGWLEHKENPHGLRGPGGKSYLYRKNPHATTP